MFRVYLNQVHLFSFFVICIHILISCVMWLCWLPPSHSIKLELVMQPSPNKNPDDSKPTNLCQSMIRCKCKFFPWGEIRISCNFHVELGVRRNAIPKFGAGNDLIPQARLLRQRQVNKREFLY
jgi:hypothetical protein